MKSSAKIPKQSSYPTTCSLINISNANVFFLLLFLAHVCFKKFANLKIKLNVDKQKSVLKNSGFDAKYKNCKNYLKVKSKKNETA